MASLSWAQIAAKHHKPSSLGRHNSGDGSFRDEIPRPALPLPVLTAADFPSLVESEDKDGHREEQKYSVTTTTPRAKSPCTGSVHGSWGDFNGESNLSPSPSKKESPPSTSPTCLSPTTSSATAATADDVDEDMVGNRKGHKAAKMAAEEVARQARLPASLELVASVSSSPAENNKIVAAAAPLPRHKHDEKRDEEHGEKRDESEEPGMNAVLISNGEEAGDASSEASSHIDIAAAAESAQGDANHRRVFRASLESGRLPNFEKDGRIGQVFRNERLFYSTKTYNCAITLRDGKVLSAHREILVSESTYLAKNLSPPNKVGVTHHKLDDFDVSMMSVVIFWVYMGELGGHRPDPSDMWSSTYILNNVMFYRPAMLLGVKSLMKYQIGNVLEAASSLRDALDGRFFYYKFGNCKKLASFEVPLRMAHIHLYTQNVEEEFADETREMKIALAKLTLIVLPFLRRQYGFTNNLQKIWEALPFPWRSEMEDFYHEGLLPDFPKCFDNNLQWVEEKTDDDHFGPRTVSSASSRTSGMPYSQASIGEMTRRLTMAGFDSGYRL
ncbi:hypothetical protein CGRA01v4_05799 [Colletotrichum graminicola]|nr:hypothetical protein CGRA01v4_05799 [Colletotrichum graminicola]